MIVSSRQVCLLAGIVLFCTSSCGTASAQTFPSSDVIVIPDEGGNAQAPVAAGIYPSKINVSNLSGTVAGVHVVLHGVHTSGNVNDASLFFTEIMLVSPGGIQLELMGGYIGNSYDDGNNTNCPNPTSGCGLQGVTITIEDGQPAMPDAATGSTPFPNTGTASFEPSAYFTAGQYGVYPNTGSPAPSPLTPNHFPQTKGGGNSSTFASAFGGAQPNGNWMLYVMDNAGDPITINGWDLILTLNASAISTSTTLASNLNPSFTSGTNSSVTLTATVSSENNGAPTGTVAFTDNGTTISNCGAQTLTAAGANSSTATCVVTFPNQGNRPVNATYTPTGSYSTSSTTNPLIQLVKAYSTNPTTDQYCNTASISLPGGFSAPIVYPSIINVPSLGNSISNLTVTLNGLNGNVGIVDGQFLLVAPDGTHNLDFLSHAGNGSPQSSINVSFADNNPFPPYGANGDPLSSTTYQPTAASNVADVFPAAPSVDPQVPGTINYPLPFGASNAFSLGQAFNGTIPTGDWSLYIVNVGGNNENMAVTGGWCVEFTLNSGTPTTTAVTSSANPAKTGQPVTFTATVQNANTSAPVTSGTVSFTENGVAPAGTVGGNNVATVNSSGVATFTTSGLSEGDHKITATYSGNGLNASSGFIWQREDAPTSSPSVSGGAITYCNPAAILIPAGSGGPLNIGPANPNPSNIFISNLFGTLNTLTVTLNSLHTATAPQISDTASLLAGPNGAGLDFYSGTGASNTQISSSNFTFADSAGSVVPNSNYTAGTFEPTSYTSGDVFSASSSGFYTPPATFVYAGSSPSSGHSFTSSASGRTPVFAGIDPSGVWSLYFDQFIHADGGGLGGGWCIAVTPNVPSLSISASHSPSNFRLSAQGEQITVSVTNNGPGAVGGSPADFPLTVTDVLPAGLTFASSSGTNWSCSASGQTVTCANSSRVTSGNTYPTLTLSVNVAANATSPLSNAPQVSLGTPGVSAGVFGSVTATADSIVVLGPPILSVTKSHNSTFTQGGTGTWTVAVSNIAAAANTTDGTAVTVTDSLTSGYSLSSYNGMGWSCSGVNSISCTNSSVVAGGSSFATLNLIVNVPTSAGINLTNTASASGGGALAGATSNTDSVTVVQVPNSIAATAGTPQSALVGAAFGLSLQATVEDAGGATIANYPVVFTAPASGPSAVFSNNQNAVTVNTNSSGVAIAAVTANSQSGPQYTVTAKAGTVGPANFLLTNNPNTVQVTVNTNVNGPTVTVDNGIPFTGTQSFTWVIGSSHSLSSTATQTFGGTQYVWQAWSDSGAISHSVTTPGTAITYTATFGTQYQLTTAVSPNGAGTVTPESLGYYNSGSPVPISATPNSGFYFSNWTGGTFGNAASASTTVTLTAPTTITANFVSPQVTIASSQPGLSFSVSGTGCSAGTGYTTPMALTWVANSTCTVTFAATQAGAAGTQYVFSNWADGGNTTNPRSFTAPLTNTTYTANFLTQYQLTTAVSPNGSGTVTPASLGYYTSGSPVTISAAPSAGFYFSSWTGGGTFGNTSAASTTVTLTAPTTITANFVSPQVTIASSQPGLSFSVSGTGCSPGTGYTTPMSLTWVANSSCIVTFAATQSGAAGTQYVFGTWADGGNTNNPRNFTAPLINTTYTADFLTQYQLTTAVSPNGTGTVTPPSLGYYTAGSPVAISATANTGYGFTNWTGGGSFGNASSASTTVTLSAPTTITANFVMVQVTIASSPSGLSFSVSGTGCSPGTGYTTPKVFSWTPNISCMVTFATPQAGASGTQYVFTQWENASTGASRTIVAPSVSTTYTASFQTQYLLTTQVSPSAAYGSISPATGYVNAGTSPQISATANLGYGFTGFTGSLTGSTPQNLTVSGPSTVTAIFVALPDVTVLSSHIGHFDQGQLSASYTIAVGNNGPGATSGTVTVTDTLPAGLTLVSMNGSGWMCGAPNPANVCTRTDTLLSGPYPSITVVVNVAANANTTVTNSVTVSASGDYNLADNTSNDPTAVDPITTVSPEVSLTQSGFARNRATGLWSATLTVTNTSGAPINGPIQVELTNLSSDATMTNNTGMFNGIPYITVSSGTLAAGASVTVTITFQNPSSGSISFTPVTVYGSF